MRSSRRSYAKIALRALVRYYGGPMPDPEGSSLTAAPGRPGCRALARTAWDIADAMVAEEAELTPAPHAEKPASPQPSLVCQWSLDAGNEGDWVTACGERIEFDIDDARFCCFCGRPLI